MLREVTSLSRYFSPDRLPILVNPQGDRNVDRCVCRLGDDRSDIAGDVQGSGGYEACESRGDDEDLAEGHLIEKDWSC